MFKWLFGITDLEDRIKKLEERQKSEIDELQRQIFLLVDELDQTDEVMDESLEDLQRQIGLLIGRSETLVNELKETDEIMDNAIVGFNKNFEITRNNFIKLGIPVPCSQLDKSENCSLERNDLERSEREEAT